MMIQNINHKNILHYGAHSLIFVDQGNEYNKPVCIKVLNEELPSSEQLKLLETEFEYSFKSECVAIRKAQQRIKVENHEAIQFDYVDGEDLKKIIQSGRLAISEKLKLSVDLANALAEVHQYHIIHNDLNPYNILVEKITGKIYYIDFSSASRAGFVSSSYNRLSPKATSFHYISPEQTGRINSGIDNRSDLYSLGVILYELFAGILPFESKDPLELIFAHIAKAPLPACDVNPRVEAGLSDIIDKLLAKNAEDRYESASGLAYDLACCYEQFESKGRIAVFELGTKDFSGKLIFRQKLYGRERETKILSYTYDKCAAGEREVVFVSGYAGSGKTALVNRLQELVVINQGHYISGKFDQLLRDKPYSAFIQAFSEFIQFLLAGDKARLSQWRSTIQEAISPLGKILTDIIPCLETLTGWQPPVPELKGIEAQNRFHYVFTNFLCAIATWQHPLLLFIDDLQWADESSFHLIQHVMSDRRLNHLMIINAYRNNETPDNHPLFKMIRDLEEKHVSISNIEITDLTREQGSELVKETLRSDQGNSKELSDIIYQKTKGNPFYIHQFMKSIHEDGLLKFNFKTGAWDWEAERIREMNVSGNVVDLMTRMVQRLPHHTIELLKLCSCFGNKFDLQKVSIIQQRNEEALQHDFQNLLHEGLVITTPGGYRFAHDRIQQTIYSLIAEEVKKILHLSIGKMLSDITTDLELPGRIFDMVDQWNLGSDIVSEEHTKNYLSDLNIQAGRKAMASSAHRQAFQYFDKAISLQLQTAWASSYENTLCLYNDAAEAAYLSGEYDITDKLINEIVHHSHQKTDCIRAHELAIQKLIAGNKYRQSIQYGLEKLAELGIHVPSKPGKLYVVAGLIRTQLLLFNKSSSYISNLPEMRDPEKLAAMRLLYEIASPVYFAQPSLLPLLAFKCVQLSVKYGLSGNTPFAFNVYGFIQSVYLGKVDKGIDYSRLALDLITRLKAEKLKASTMMSYHVFFVHWKTHLPDTIPGLEEAFRIGLETGDYEYSSYLAHNIIYHSFYSGINLDNLLKEGQLLDKQIEPFRQELTIKRLKLFLQSISNLTGPGESPLELTGEFFDESQVEIAEDSRNDIYYQNLYLQKTFLALIFNHADKAYEFAGKAALYQESIKGSALYPLFYYYESLAITDRYKSSTVSQKKKHLQQLEKNISLLKKYETLCAKNYSHKRLLVESEYKKITNQKAEARTLYDQAIRLATDSMLNDEALCWERAGIFYVENGEEKIARFYLNNAARAYHRWGAKAKVRQMTSHYGLAKSLSADSWQEKEPQYEDASTSSLDLNTVLKASTALSGEIVFSRLLKKLMQIIMENAGAQQGFFIMEKKGDLFIEAESHTNNDHVIIEQPAQVANSNKLAISIINYVQLTRETVLLDNAATSSLFAKDDFIKKQQPKSILCMPFIHQGKLQGVIYLSNNLITGAFTEKRIALLRLLTGQIAISIENSLFYEDLENKVQERTEELRMEKKKSDDLLLNILPENVAAELKLTGRAQPRYFEKVAVLFTDFKDFTQVSEKLTPEELVSEIDMCFRKIDEIISTYKLEKIKTIGDAYLCVSGLPNPDDYSITNTINAAMEIIAFVKRMQEQRMHEGKTFFSIRIGVHAGPLVAGIVGDKKFAYDIWGDTVNTAARMEQSSESNRINISGAVYQYIKDGYNCTYRGKIAAKNKGKIDMYFVESEKALTSLPGKKSLISEVN